MIFKMHVVQRLLSRRCSPVLNLRSTVPVIKINTSFSGLHSFKRKEKRELSIIQLSVVFFCGRAGRASENIFKYNLTKVKIKVRTLALEGSPALGSTGSLLHHPSPLCSDLVKRDAGKAHNSSDPGTKEGRAAARAAVTWNPGQAGSAVFPMGGRIWWRMFLLFCSDFLDCSDER